MKIYMDVCCFNRPFDDQTQDRIRIESDAILAILSKCMSGRWQLLSSEVIDIEIKTLEMSGKRIKFLNFIVLRKKK